MIVMLALVIVPGISAIAVQILWFKYLCPHQLGVTLGICAALVGVTVATGYLAVDPELRVGYSAGAMIFAMTVITQFIPAAKKKIRSEGFNPS